MKKIWKNLCACSMALACGVGLVACKDDDDNSPRDLDGDGVVSSWEQFFEDNTGSDHSHSSGHVVVGDVFYINNAEDLKSINKKTEERKIYVLNSNIDLGGETVCIDLGLSEFYGNNYVISNFKLGSVDSLNIVDDVYSYNDKIVKCLFYNGTGVFGTRVFMGVQSLHIDSATERSYYSISPFFNVPALNGIEVKGKLDILSVRKDGRSGVRLDASLLYSGCATKIDAEGQVSKNNDVLIDTVSVDGNITFNEAKNSLVTLNMGAIASSISKESTVYNAYSQCNIYAGVSEYGANIGGIVGKNDGFVSTCTSTGVININNSANNYADNESVGGIVGYNGKLAEIKNCSTNIKMNFDNTQMETESVDKYYFGGIVGTNVCGIIELCQSDAEMSFNNLYAINVGGFCGFNDNGVISYGICRGNINAKNVKKTTVAQVAGISEKGYFEKIITNTSINVDVSKVEILSVDVGMVTTFKWNNRDTGPEAPYFRRILVDGTTKVITDDRDKSRVNYKHGLRHDFKIFDHQDEGQDVFVEVLPAIFENVYKTTSCNFVKYSVVNGVAADDGISVQYVNAVGTSNNTPRWIIDYLDFKNHLNHNEVSLGDYLALKDLHFTITDKKTRMQSYFGYSKYNGELAYFDQEFTDAYQHLDSAIGSCENDSKDELFSFVYDLINSNNGKTQEHYVVKLNDEFLNKTSSEGVGEVDGLSQNVNLLKDRFEGVFTCLNLETPPVVTRLDANGVNLDFDEAGTLKAKYIVFTFKDSINNYSLKIDISNLDSDLFEGEYILYLTFNVSSIIG